MLIHLQGFKGKSFFLCHPCCGSGSHSGVPRSLVTLETMRGGCLGKYSVHHFCGPPLVRLETGAEFRLHPIAAGLELVVGLHREMGEKGL